MVATDVMSDVAATSWGPQRIDVFWYGPRNAIQHLWRNGLDGSSWNTENLGGQAIGTPAAVAWGVGKLSVFHRGLSNAVFGNLWHDGRWHGWTSLDGEIVGNPVAVSSGEGRIDVFHRGGGLDVYHRSFDGTTMKWSDGWVCTCTHAILIDDIAAVAPTTGTIYLFGIDSNNRVVFQTYTARKWVPWASLENINPRSRPSAVAFEGSAVVVAVQGHDNAVYVNTRQVLSGPWSGWARVGDQYVATVMPVLHPRGTFSTPVFVRGQFANLLLLSNMTPLPGTPRT